MKEPMITINKPLPEDELDSGDELVKNLNDIAKQNIQTREPMKIDEPNGQWHEQTFTDKAKKKYQVTFVTNVGDVVGVDLSEVVVATNEELDSKQTKDSVTARRAVVYRGPIADFVRSGIDEIADHVFGVSKKDGK